MQSLVWEDPLEKDMATDSSILAWKIPWTEKPDRLQSMGLQKNWTQLSDSVQFSHVQLFVTPWTTACQANQSITNPWSLLKFMCIDSVMPSNHLVLCHSVILMPTVFPCTGVSSSIRLFTSGGQSIGASASASVLPMNIQG